MATLRAKQYPYYTVYKWEVSYLDFNSAVGATSNKFLGYIPQRHNIAWIKIIYSTRFNGGAISNSVIHIKPDIGGSIAPLTTSKIATCNVFAIPVDYQGVFKYASNLDTTLGGTTRSYAGSQSVANGVWAQLFLTGGVGTALARGEATIWVGTIPSF